MKSSHSNSVRGSPDSAFTLTESHPSGWFMDNQRVRQANR